MTKQAFSIQIPNPCHEAWEKMLPVNGGAYCQACSKVVRDFTVLSDAELIKVFTEKKSGELCGRFLKGQLQRTYQPIAQPSGAPHRLLKLIFIAVLSIRLPLYGQDLHTNPKPKVQKEQQKKPAQNTLRTIGFIKGKVTDKDTRKGIVVKIRVYANTNTTDLINEVFSDSNGYYKIGLPDTGLARFFKLTFENEQYGERSVVVDKFRTSPVLNLRLVPQYVVEITTTAVIREDYNQIQTGTSLRRDWEDVSSGPAVDYHTAAERVNFWYKLKRGFRRLFNRN